MPLVVFKNGTPLDANDLNNNFGQLTTASGVGSDTSPGSSFAVNGATGSARRINFLTAGLTDATVGLDTGNDFVIDRYKSGVSQERVVQVSNASGITTINSTAGLTLQGTGGTTTLGGSLKMGSTTATGLGTGIGQIPVFVNYNASGHPGLKTTGRIIIGRQTTTENDFADLQVNRDSTSVVTTNQTLLNSGIRVIQTTGSQDQSLNWALVSTITNNQDTGAGNSVAIVGYGFRTKALNGAFTFGGVFGAFDSSSLTSLNSKGPLVGAEIDTAAYDLDNASNGHMFGGKGSRVVLNLVAMRQSASGTNQTEISQGLWFSTTTNPVPSGSDSHTNYNSMIGTAVNVQAYQMLDSRGGIVPTGYTDPFAAVRMSANQIIDFNGGAALNSNAGDYIQYTTTGTARIRVMSGANENFSISATAGNVITRGTLQVNSSGSAPITISSGSIASATSQNLNIVTGGAANTVNVGNGPAGLGQALTITTNSGGNTFGHASPNTVAANNKLTAQTFATPGNTITYSGSIDPKVVQMTFNLAGNSTAAIKPIVFNVSSDTFDASGSSNAPATVSISHNVGGAGTKGGRILFLPLLNVNSTISGDTTSQQYQPIYSQAQATVNVGGTNTTTSSRGSLYGGGNQAILYSGATNWTLLNGGGEMDIAAASGSSVRDIYGMSIVLLSNHAVAGTRENSALVFANQNGAARTWTLGLSYGNSDGDWSFSTASTLIGTMLQINYGNASKTAFLQMPRATYGIDWEAVDFSQQSGKAFRSAGFSVDGTGQGNFGGGLFIGTAANGYKIDVPAVNVITAVSVSTAGTGSAGANNYYPNDIVYGTSSPTKGQYLITHTKVLTATVVSGGTGGTPGAVTITGTTGTGTKFQATGTINGGGVLTGALTVTVAGDYTVNPTNPAVEPVTGGGLSGCTVSLGIGALTVSILVPDVSTTTPATITPTGGSGTGLVLTPTWTAKSQIDINPTGGVTTFSGPIYISSLPTSPSGLTAGRVWNNGGVLCVA